jgi:hypothetical protein
MAIPKFDPLPTAVAVVPIAISPEMVTVPPEPICTEEDPAADPNTILLCALSALMAVMLLLPILMSPDIVPPASGKNEPVDDPLSTTNLPEVPLNAAKCPGVTDGPVFCTRLVDKRPLSYTYDPEVSVKGVDTGLINTVTWLNVDIFFENTSWPHPWKKWTITTMWSFTNTHTKKTV